MATLSRPESSIGPMTTDVPIRLGHCVCGVPLADHYGKRNEQLACDVARRRWTDRLEKDRSHLALVTTVLATVALARTDRLPTAPTALESLTASERNEVTWFAQAALTSLDRTRRKLARERGIAEAIEAFRKTTGHLELPRRLAWQIRQIVEEGFNAYDCALQGVIAITDAEVAHARQLEPLPEATHADGFREEGGQS